MSLVEDSPPAGARAWVTSRRVARHERFTLMPPTTFQSAPTTLSWAGQGLFSFLAQQPADQRISRKLIDAASTSSRNSTTAAIAELRRAGRLRLIQGCDPTTRRASSCYQFAVKPNAFPDLPAGMRALEPSRPNGDAGEWRGPWPLAPTDPRPPYRMPVVYVLDPDQPRPLYVGSTSNFLARLRRHEASGKRWTHWLAYPCATRQAAFDLEERWADELRPLHEDRRPAGGES
jgi:hypothetical protein